MKKISVVLAAHYRPDLLRKTLQAILQQSFPKQDYEVIVVGFEGDKSLNPVEKEFSKKGVRFFRTNSSFVDRKRNFGARKARHEIIAFTDHDCLPEKDWLKSIAAEFEKRPGLAGVEGLTWNDNKQLYCHAPKNLEGNQFLACNYGFRKDVFNEVNGFDERYFYYREDTDLAFKILEKGHKIVFSKKARVFHPAVKQSLNTPLKDLKHVRNDILLFKKFPKRFRKHFGFVCRGLFKLSAFAWLALAAAIYAAISRTYIVVILATASVFALKIFVEKKGKKANVFEWAGFIFFSYIRDLAFPVFFAYYWLANRQKKGI